MDFSVPPHSEKNLEFMNCNQQRHSNVLLDNSENEFYLTCETFNICSVNEYKSSAAKQYFCQKILMILLDSFSLTVKHIPLLKKNTQNTLIVQAVLQYNE